MRASEPAPAVRPVALDRRARVWADASAVLGGAPWGIIRIAPAGRDFVARLRSAGTSGLTPSPGLEATLADLLLVRGIVHPVIAEPDPAAVEVDIVVPAYQRPDLLEICLTAIRSASPQARIIVVDDASTDSSVGDVARAHGATLIRHTANRGPAAARNSGLRESDSPLVAFVDADCAVTPGWLEPLVSHFDDPRVVAVAPRISPRAESDGVLARFQTARSALDMGPDPELVTHGAPLGFLPSATVLIRRDLLSRFGFDEAMRVGEDVDLIWRLVDDGGLVRYEPGSTVTHAIRPAAGAWAARVFAYGTSAAELDRRHAGRLAPARLSGWSVAVAGLALARRPGLAVGVVGLATGLLARTLRPTVDPRIAPVVVGKRLLSDAGAIGHLLRREWWPIGWLALARAPRSRPAVAAAAVMLIPVVREWFSRPSRVDLPRYLGLRLAEDAAYGSGVIAGAVRTGRFSVLAPVVRITRLWRRPAPPARPPAPAE